MDHREEAVRRLKLAEAEGREEALVDVGVAAVHALLHLADTVGHGLRDIVYELRS